LKFKRQAAIGRFVADFLCAEHHLIVELDGGQHGLDANIARDTDRTAQLEAMGYTVVRFWNIDVLQNIGGVLDTILDQLDRLEPAQRECLEPPHPVPLPSGARGPTDSAQSTRETSTQTVTRGSPPAEASFLAPEGRGTE
jgi:hypothetical protein